MGFLDKDGLRYFWQKIKPKIEEAGKTGGVSTGAVIGWTGEEIPEGYEEVDSSLMPSGVEVGTIVEWEDGVEVPEGWEEVTDYGAMTYVKGTTTITTDANGRFTLPIPITALAYNVTVESKLYFVFARYLDPTGIIFYMRGIDNFTATPNNATFTIHYSYTKPKEDIKQIKKVSVTPIEGKTGHIYDTTNIDNKAENTYSANIIDGLLSPLREKNIITVTTTTEQKLTANATREKMILNAVYSKIGSKLSLDVTNNEIVIGEGVNTIKVSGQVLFSKASTGYTHDLRIFKTGDVALGVNMTNSILGGQYCVSPIITPIVVGGLKAGDVIYAKVVGAKDDTVAASAPATYITVEVVN